MVSFLSRLNFPLSFIAFDLWTMDILYISPWRTETKTHFATLRYATTTLRGSVNLCFTINFAVSRSSSVAV